MIIFFKTPHQTVTLRLCSGRFEGFLHHNNGSFAYAPPLLIHCFSQIRRSQTHGEQHPTAPWRQLNGSA